MRTPDTLTLAVTPEIAACLRLALQTGEYATESEIVGEALRDWTRARETDEAKLAWLREAIRIGDESGPSIPAAEVYAHLDKIIAERRTERA